jgi:signal transduction histidine kinase
MLSLNLESALKLANGRLRDRLAKLSLLTRECLLEVRQYIFDLRPLLTGEAELADALRGQIKEFQTITGLPVRLDLVGETRSLSLGVAITAYRVAQEALANAFRHAHASQIMVTLRYTDSGLEMLIDDDGCGIPAGIEGDGHGLRNMRERVTSHGGSIHLEGRPQEGTRVRIALPFA